MLQRPGCFVFYVLAAFIGLAMFIGWVNETRASAAVATPFADGQQNAEAVVAPTASATSAMTPTPNPLVLTEASSNATHGAALTALANDEATRDTGTRIASTQTPAYWTAVAVDVEQQREAAVRDKVLLEAQLLAGTITAAPTSEWKTEVAVWPTIEAQMTQAAFDQQTADNARKWGRIAADAWSLVLVAIPVSIIIALVVSSIVMPAAFSWRVQGVSGGQAQAAVVSAARTVPVNENKKTRDVVLDADRAQLIRFVDMCRAWSGDDATTITPQNDERIRSKEWWRQCVKALGELDLVDASQGSGHGTAIKHNRTLADLADVLRKGTE
jgi:hypothetical protein